MNLSCKVLKENRQKNKFILIFKDNQILVKNTKDKYIIPSMTEISRLNITLKNCYVVQELNDAVYYLAEMDNNIKLFDEYTYKDVKTVISEMDENLFRIIGQASHINHWHLENKFCGFCGSLTARNYDKTSIECFKCKTTYYPRISPAIIVAITKEDKILLAKNINSKSNFLSVLAGYVEPGESLEDCLRREVKEEVDIEVKNIKYFGSQPWPFPDSLMVGFTAEYASGEIKVEKEELAYADWFTADSLPEIPGPQSISRRLIDWFIEENL